MPEEASVRAWARELRSVLMSLEDVLELGIDEVLLAGGSAQLGGLGTFLGALLGVAGDSLLLRVKLKKYQ